MEEITESGSGRGKGLVPSNLKALLRLPSLYVFSGQGRSRVSPELTIL